MSADGLPEPTNKSIVHLIVVYTFLAQPEFTCTIYALNLAEEYFTLTENTAC